jgi:SlyX protein
MDDDRLIDIETKLAHQEHTIADLNEAVTAQQSQISMLQSHVEALTARLRSLSEALPVEDAGDEKPPHY